MVAIVGFNAAAGALIWYMGLGGTFQKLAKLVGIAQKMKIQNAVVKGLAIAVKGIKFIANMVIKGGSKRRGESWFSAIKKFAKNNLGFSI